MISLIKDIFKKKKETVLHIKVKTYEQYIIDEHKKKQWANSLEVGDKVLLYGSDRSKQQWIFIGEYEVLKKNEAAIKIDCVWFTKGRTTSEEIELSYLIEQPEGYKHV